MIHKPHAFSLVWLCLALLCVTNTSSALREAEPGLPPLLTQVPSIIQSTSYSCGAATVISVLAYYGIDSPSEAELMVILGTTEHDGTEMEKMAEYANSVGIKAEVRTGLSLDDIAKQVAEGQPVIVDAQAYHDGGATKPPYPQLWGDGHYMVVIGIDATRIYFRDPSLAGSVGYLTRQEFEDRWHDVSKKNEKLLHAAILFQGKPQPPPALAVVP
jgi:predicted double-glycine peptidase